MKLYKKGLTVDRLIKILKGFPKTKQILISSDEEMNALFKGFYITEDNNDIIFAGITGLEVGEEEQLEDMKELSEKCGRCGLPTPTEELEILMGICSRCANMTDEGI